MESISLRCDFLLSVLAKTEFLNSIIVYWINRLEVYCFHFLRWRGVFRTQSNIDSGAFLHRAKKLPPVNYCELPSPSSLIFFLETFLLVCSLAGKKRITLKTEIFAVLLFSNFVKRDDFQRTFPLKFRLRKLIPAKEVFETHLRKSINIGHLNSNL